MLEQKVIQKAVAGDDEAFLQFIHTYKTDLFRTAIYFFQNEERALEAVQEVTYRAYKNIKKLREPKYAKTWLMRIMINYCNDELKKSQRIIVSEESLQGSVVNDDARRLEVQEALWQLDEPVREIITLKYFHDLTLKEVARALNRPEGTVKTWLYKGLQTMKEFFQERGGMDD